MAKKVSTKISIQEIKISDSELYMKLNGLRPRVHGPRFDFVSGSAEAKKAIKDDYKKIQDSSALIRHPVTSYYFNTTKKQHEIECTLDPRSRVLYLITSRSIWEGRN